MDPAPDPAGGSAPDRVLAQVPALVVARARVLVVAHVVPAVDWEQVQAADLVQAAGSALQVLVARFFRVTPLTPSSWKATRFRFNSPTIPWWTC